MIPYGCLSCPTNITPSVRNQCAGIFNIHFCHWYAAKCLETKLNIWCHMISYDFLWLCRLSHQHTPISQKSVCWHFQSPFLPRYAYKCAENKLKTLFHMISYDFIWMCRLSDEHTPISQKSVCSHFQPPFVLSVCIQMRRKLSTYMISYDFIWFHMISYGCVGSPTYTH